MWKYPKYTKKLWAVGSLKRSPLFPNLPTLDKSGLKGFDADSKQFGKIIRE
jgi:tripartite-type tricarboxylate transporter receptor subunit TctC